jgi:hypothetical protein
MIISIFILKIQSIKTVPDNESSDVKPKFSIFSVLKIALVTLIIGGNLYTYYNQNFNSLYKSRPPYREAVNVLKSNYKNGEFILIHPNIAIPTVQIYLGGQYPLIPLEMLDIQKLKEKQFPYKNFWLISTSGYQIKELNDKIQDLKNSFPNETVFMNNSYYQSAQIELVRFKID